MDASLIAYFMGLFNRNSKRTERGEFIPYQKVKVRFGEDSFGLEGYEFDAEIISYLGDDEYSVKDLSNNMNSVVSREEIIE